MGAFDLDPRLLLAAQRFAGCAALRGDEYEDVLALLLEYGCENGCNTSDETVWLAGAVAAACMGDNHLWQDLGLANRQELSELLSTHFPALHAKNTGNMKWKKFFYKQLCERAEIRACRAPSCAVCSDYAACFEMESQ
jgi:nitrogen fixation protein NifQ